MTPEQQQEEISKAYLHAVVAQCSFALGAWTQDHGCVDVTVGAASPVGSGHLSKPKVDIQLKATTRTDVEHPEFISWQLEADHYNALVAPASAPHLLVVLLLPSDISQSIEHTVNHLLIRRCAYWVTMTGQMDLDPAAQSKTVRIPRAQVFSPSALRGIMEQVSQGTTP
ncbi:MAG: DUF4365 domain-containing protein [Polyangiaceae bacterium]|nr:DUF4365 domain-containing protein [Polyangiaceae bacterium]